MEWGQEFWDSQEGASWHAGHQEVFGAQELMGIQVSTWSQNFTRIQEVSGVKNDGCSPNGASWVPRS